MIVTWDVAATKAPVAKSYAVMESGETVHWRMCLTAL